MGNQAIFYHLLDRSQRMTEEWFRKRSKLTDSFYAAAPKEISERIKEQNRLFIAALTNVLIEPEEAEAKLNDWASEVAYERVQLNVPLGQIIHQFKLFRQIYLREMEQFAANAGIHSILQDFFSWNRRINEAFDSVIEMFNKQYTQFSVSRLKAQTELVHQLSSPVITLKTGVGVLPLIGSIDAGRAAFILEAVLEQSAEKQVSRLFIDLSGVAFIDTAAAQKICQIIQTLKLIGVHATLSGIRPEVARTAIQLGIHFSDITVEGTLEQALANLEKEKNPLKE